MAERSYYMTKRMLIDSTQDEETRVVVVNGNKLEDVEFETSHRKQIKGNIYLAKVMRVEPSLQACFVDYGGNKHGFLAFGEIHPDYYTMSQQELDAIDKEVNDTIENKKQSIKDRELERERIREEKAAAYAKRMAEKAATDAAKEAAKVQASSESQAITADGSVENNEMEIAEASVTVVSVDAQGDEIVSEEGDKKHPQKKRLAKKRIRKRKEDVKVLSESTGLNDERVSDDSEECTKCGNDENGDFDVEDDDDDEMEMDFELQKKLLRARKLFHRSKIQDVIKEGQTLLIQVVKEERGNKGAALTTYLSLAGRYCVLMPNRIKSGGVSRKITNVADRKRLKGIVKELPLNTDMSLIVRTAGEEKTRADIVRDYNYLIRSWNIIRIASLKSKAPSMIHEEGNLIKRALRDIYTKEIAEIIVSGDDGYKMAKEFFRILSPNNLKKIKYYRNNEMPLFQRFQVEGQLDKLHEATAQLESGGYLVINPTEALVAIDVNSGRATKEKDLEETALKTNLEACDEIAKQLRMRNLAGLVVIDFIDMEEQSNNHAIEKRMKEALKKDRSRIQVGKMSCFGLLEISRQRMHSSFMESNYHVCPHCHGQGMVRTIESSAVFVLRGIEEEGIKGRSSRINIFVPSEIAIYLLNQKRQSLMALEQKYKMNVIISADDTVENIADYRIDRTKSIAPKFVAAEETNRKPTNDEIIETQDEEIVETKDTVEKISDSSNENTNGSSENDTHNGEQDNAENRGRNRRRRDRRNRRGRDYNDRRFNNENRLEGDVENTSGEPNTPRSEEQPVCNEEPRNNNEEHHNNEERRNNNDDRRNRNGDRRHHNNDRRNRNDDHRNHNEKKQEAVILYNSHEDNTSSNGDDNNKDTKGKTTWWKKLIKS